MKIYGESWMIRRPEETQVDTFGRAVMQLGRLAADLSVCLYEKN